MSITYDPGTDCGAIEVAEPDNPDVIPVRLEIQFQHGPVGDNGINGVQNEEILTLLALRLRALNAAFPCRENSLAITKIEEATMWLEHRTRLRTEQRVEGQNLAHVS